MGIKTNGLFLCMVIQLSHVPSPSNWDLWIFFLCIRKICVGTFLLKKCTKVHVLIICDSAITNTNSVQRNIKHLMLLQGHPEMYQNTLCHTEYYHFFINYEEKDNALKSIKIKLHMTTIQLYQKFYKCVESEEYSRWPSLFIYFLYI